MTNPISVFQAWQTDYSYKDCLECVLIRKYFNADISDPNHYDLVANTGFLSIETAVEAVGSVLGL